MDTTYNGWTNYATWRIMLEWFQDDDHIRELERTAIDSYDLSQRMKEYVFDSWEEYNESGNPFMDYAYSFLEDVNWVEIGEACWNEINEDNEE